MVIPAYTCFSVPSAIIKAGLQVSLCDIDPSTLDFDYKLLEKSLNNKTLCVLATHLFGMPADMERIQHICKDKHIPVVEDAAQAMGSKCNGKFLGTIGDVGFFSLGRGKNITCGSGGVIITNNDMIAGAIEKVYTSIERPSLLEEAIEFGKVIAMACFIRPSLYWLPAGLPFLKLGETNFYSEFPMEKMSGMRAGLLRRWKKQLEESNRIRMENSIYFCSTLTSTSTSTLTLPFPYGKSIPFLRFPVICSDKATRDQLYSLSKEKGLGIAKMYPTPISEIQEIRDQFKDKRFPAAKLVADRLVTVPTHAFLRERDKKNIFELFNVFFIFALTSALTFTLAFVFTFTLTSTYALNY